MCDSVREREFVVEREYVGPCGGVCMWVRRKKLVGGILVFSYGSLVKIDHFYCSLVKLRPFIVCWPN